MTIRKIWLLILGPFCYSLPDLCLHSLSGKVIAHGHADVAYQVARGGFAGNCGEVMPVEKNRHFSPHVSHFYSSSRNFKGYVNSNYGSTRAAL